MKTYYVLKSDDIALEYGLPFGNDSNSGLSPKEPFKTMRHAEAVSRYDDEIRVCSGNIKVFRVRE